MHIQDCCTLEVFNVNLSSWALHDPVRRPSAGLRNVAKSYLAYRPPVMLGDTTYLTANALYFLTGKSDLYIQTCQIREDVSSKCHLEQGKLELENSSSYNHIVLLIRILHSKYEKKNEHFIQKFD